MPAKNRIRMWRVAALLLSAMLGGCEELFAFLPHFDVAVPDGTGLSYSPSGVFQTERP